MFRMFCNNLNGAAFINATFSSLSTLANNTLKKEADKLYRAITVEVRGHDRAVLNSYEIFTKTAAQELDITIDKISEPKKHLERRTLLKSAFKYKKHRVQYEFRTYFRVFELKYLTGSTADTFLEYIQRNLPEGVAMKVTKHCIEKIPEAVINLEASRQTDTPDDAQMLIDK